jgi:dipeptidyl aminopeptidase/acylaminoacyl peptidase
MFAITISGSTSPGRIFVVSRYSPAATPAITASVAAWTAPYMPPGIDASAFSEQSIIRFPSFDGRIISAIANYPTAAAAAAAAAAADSQKLPPFPVLICIHGGPESQAVCGFLGRLNYFVAEMGFVILQPNVRGSSGYGKTFLDLDNGVLREDAVRASATSARETAAPIATRRRRCVTSVRCWTGSNLKRTSTAVAWLCTEAAMVCVEFRRAALAHFFPGGYMSLAVSFHYPERIVAAIDVVGISNFVTFLTNTESYRRDLRRVECAPMLQLFLHFISLSTDNHLPLLSSLLSTNTRQHVRR